MGTLKTAIDNALVKVRDSGQNITEFTHTNLIAMINHELLDIYQNLVFLESNLVYKEATLTALPDTIETTPAFTFDGLLESGMWLDDADWYLAKLSESHKPLFDYGNSTSEPRGYFVTEDGKIGWLPVPDATYTVHCEYWAPPTMMASYTADSLPWRGLFNQYIERKLILEMLEMLEADNSRHAMMAEMAYNKALQMVYKRGTRRKRQSSDLFDGIEGI